MHKEQKRQTSKKHSDHSRTSVVVCQLEPHKAPQSHVERHPGVEVTRGLRSDWLLMPSTNQSLSFAYLTNHVDVIYQPIIIQSYLP